MDFEERGLNLKSGLDIGSSENSLTRVAQVSECKDDPNFVLAALPERNRLGI